MTQQAVTALLAAASTGLLGSLHCFAMCGPLAATGCTKGGNFSVRASAGYFLGRFMSYATVGAVMGMLGHQALISLPVQWVQWVVVATVVALAAGRGLVLLRPRQALVNIGVNVGDHPPSRISLLGTSTTKLLASMFPTRGLGLGLATGLMPCGLLVLAWALAAGTASPVHGAAVMFVFALASAPGLVVPVVGRRVLQRLAARLPSSAAGLAWCGIAVWVGARAWFASGPACH